MRAPRVLTDQERGVIRRALESAAVQTRTTLAKLRTSELLSRDVQQSNRDELQALAHQQDLLAAAIDDKARSLVLLAGDALPPGRSKTKSNGG